MIRYVHEQGKPNNEQTSRMMLALVFAIMPLRITHQQYPYFARVVFMNFFLYLWRYLLPSVRTPSTRLNRPIPMPP